MFPGQGVLLTAVHPVPVVTREFSRPHKHRRKALKCICGISAAVLNTAQIHRIQLTQEEVWNHSSR